MGQWMDQRTVGPIMPKLGRMWVQIRANAPADVRVTRVAEKPLPRRRRLPAGRRARAVGVGLAAGKVLGWMSIQARAVRIVDKMQD